MEISILFFGELAELVGTKKTVVQNIQDTVSLHEYLLKQYPCLASRTYRMALDKEFVSEKQNLTNGTEVALLPPFAGG